MQVSTPLAIIEGDPLIRQSYHIYLCAQPEFDCVLMAGSIGEFLEELSGCARPPRLVLSDVGLPDLSGIEGVARIRRVLPQAEVVLITVYADAERLFQALCAGAVGYLLKTSLLRDVKTALLEVLDGGSPMSPAIARHLVRHFKPALAPAELLTARELQLVQAIEEGLSYRLVAGRDSHCPQGWRMVSEGSTLTLTAPAGYVFTAVDFASYGNPTGSTGNYSLGSCYASSSRSVVEAALLGHTGTVSIAATNATFGGDPCGNVGKALAVRAYYTSMSYPGGAPATATLSYSCAELGTQPVLLTLTNAAGGSTTVGTSVTVSSPAATSLTWTGATSNDWADCANWSYGRVPTTATDVLIPAGLARYPSLTIGTSLVKDITVELGASLTTSAGTTLQVAGNWNVNGTTTLAGPVTFMGSGTQTLGGLGNATFTTLSVNKPLGVLTLQRAVSVTSSLTLTLSSGFLNTDAYDLHDRGDPDRNGH